RGLHSTMIGSRFILSTPRSRFGHIKLISSPAPSPTEELRCENILQTVRASASPSGHGNSYVYAWHLVEQPLSGGLTRPATPEIAVLVHPDLRGLDHEQRDGLIDRLRTFLATEAQAIVERAEKKASLSEYLPDPELDSALAHMLPTVLQTSGSS